MVHELRSLPVERLKLLVFDLDGTLIDSAQDLCNSVNATLIHFGREQLEDATIAAMIGDGVLMLVRRAFARASGPRRTRICWARPTPGFSNTIASTSWTSLTPTREFSRRWRRCGRCATSPAARAWRWPC